MLSSALLAAFLSLQGADVSTSCYGFTHGYHETNKLTGTRSSCAVIAAESAGVDVAALWLTRRHPRWRVAVLAVGVALEAKAVTHNVKELRRR